jgi:hypothetical protein
VIHHSFPSVDATGALNMKNDMAIGAALSQVSATGKFPLVTIIHQVFTTISFQLDALKK